MRHNVQLRVSQPVPAPHRPDDSDYLRWRIRELEASERRHRALMEQSADVTALVAPNGTILYQSPSTSHNLGYGPHELTGRSLFEYVHPQDAALISRAWSLIVQMPGRSQALSFRYRHKDGAWRVMEGFGTNRLHEPDVQAVVVNIHDVTTEQESAERLLARNRHLQQQTDDLRELNRALQALCETATPGELYGALTERARALTHADGAALLLCEGTGGTLYCANVQPAADNTPEAAATLARPLVDRVMAEAQAVGIGDGALDGTTDELLAQLTGIQARAIIAVPLLTGNVVEGVLACLSVEPRTTTRNDEHTLSALAGAASVALANLRLIESERGQRRAADALREAGTELARSLDAERVLDDAIGAMTSVMEADAVAVMLLEGNELRIARWHDAASGERDAAPPPRVDLERCPVLANALHDRRAIAVSDTHAATGLDSSSDWTAWQSLAAAPIGTDAAAGCLVGFSVAAGRFTPVDADRLALLANQVAAALNSARRYAEAEQAAAEAKAIAHRLAEAQEKERRRIAREIHDEAGQSLTSILVQLKMLESAEQPFEQLCQQADQARRQVSEVLDNLHQLATRLRPPALDHLGLVASLRQQAIQFKRQYGLDVNFEVVGLGDERFAAEIETAVYRFVQEALTNVARHAGARRVDIILERRDKPESGGELVAIVEDDGCGFDVESAKGAGRLGLLGMEERVSALGGRVLIESQPGSGATLFAQVPCPAPARDPETADVSPAIPEASMRQRETVTL